MNTGGTSNCLNCGSGEVRRVDKYRYNVEFDRQLLGCDDVLGCNACGLFFADPMPAVTVLEDYYGRVYRAEGRPHWNNPKCPPRPDQRHYSLLSTISQSIDVDRLTSVFEIGPGAGELGLLLKAAFPKVDLYCAEPDQYSHELLQNRGYVNVPVPSVIGSRVDLVISVHSLEHFSSIAAFFENVEQVLSPQGTVFVEVPNCPFGDGYEKRPYDSPHLLFFTARSIRAMFERRGYEVLSLSTVGPSFQEGFKRASEWKNEFGAWSAEAPFPSFKTFVRCKLSAALPHAAEEALRWARNPGFAGGSFERSSAIWEFVHNRASAWNLRAVLKRRANG